MGNIRFIEYQFARETIHRDHLQDVGEFYAIPHTMIIDGVVYATGRMEIIDEKVDPTLVIHLHNVRPDGSLSLA